MPGEGSLKVVLGLLRAYNNVSWHHYPNLAPTTLNLTLTHSTCSAQDRPGAEELAPGEGSLEFDEVNYSYAAGSPVLKGVSFKCAGGQTLALVGATGMPIALL